MSLALPAHFRCRRDQSLSLHSNGSPKIESGQRKASFIEEPPQGRGRPGRPPPPLPGAPPGPRQGWRIRGYSLGNTVECGDGDGGGGKGTGANVGTGEAAGENVFAGEGVCVVRDAYWNHLLRE